MVATPENAREAWQLYVSAGRISADLLRPDVYHAWERAHTQGARADQFEAQTLSQRQTERLLQEHDELLAAARPFLTALSQAAGSERHAAMLGDERGIVLDVVGDEQSVHGPERVPGPGSLLSEAVTGSNGIGTPLAELRYAQLVGPEHFIGGFHPFTCQGIPLRDGEQTIGVLSTSVRRVAASQRLHDILICAAHGIEAEVLCQRLQRDVERVLSTASPDATLLEELRQDVVQSHAIAKINVQVAAQLFPTDQREYARQLLSSAQESIGEFRQQARLWQELASGQTGVPKALELDRLVLALMQLLRTEASTRRVEVMISDCEQTTIVADRRQLMRDLLRAFLHAFAVAGQGGAVMIRVRATPSEQVQLLPKPAPATVLAAPQTIALTYPLAEEPGARGASR